jgi:hypothetical protein
VVRGELSIILALGAALGACTAPNPAWRPWASPDDAGEEGTDAAVAPRDHRAPDATIAPDAATPALSADAMPALPADATVPADLPTPVDVSLPRDLAADLAPDLPPPLGGLVAYWRLDRTGGTTALDDMGKNAGALLGSAAWTDQGFATTRFTNAGSVQLDGVSGGVRLGVATLPALDRPKTISFWYWMSAVPTAQRKTLLVLTNTPGKRSIQIGIETGRIAQWDWNRAIGSGDIYAPGPALTGWQHVGYTFDGQTQALYLLGTRVGTSGFSGTGPVTDAFLGTFDPATDTRERFVGRIDDVRIYNRALSATEMAELAAGRP